MSKMSWPWNRGQRSLKVIESVFIRSIVYGFLLVFFSNFVPKTHRFWDIRLISIPWPCPGWGSLKVIENCTIQSGTHDFLLTFHSNHRPISYRFRYKRRYPSKITRKSPIFPPLVYLTPRWRGSPWNFVSAQGSQKTRMMGLSDGRKSFCARRLSVERYSYSDVAGWVAGCPSQPVLYQND